MGIKEYICSIMEGHMKIIIGTRGSTLALKQAEIVLEKLKNAYPMHTYQIQIITTKGDRIQDVALDKMNDKGIFVKEIEHALKEGRIDLAVHSLKDMPSECILELTYAKTIGASDHRDCLVLKQGLTLADLPKNAIIATGSKRRKYQLLKLRPDLQVIGIRGNVMTRLKKMQEGNIDGLVLASAGLQRLGLSKYITHYFEPSEIVPACGQGILALQVRKESPLLTMIERIHDSEASQRSQWERLFLASVDGSCHIPVGSYAKIDGEQITFYSLLGNESGSRLETRIDTFTTQDATEQIQKIAEALKRSIYES